MSPFVIRQGAQYTSLLRVVPEPQGPDTPTGIIVLGSSEDGLSFVIDDKPAIAPGASPTAPDAGGCEDPTIVALPSGGYVVYYTGVDASRQQGCLNVAVGPALDALVKKGAALAAPMGEGNIKEATLVQTSTGSWRLFYEYAQDNASRIGLAAGDSPRGPWTPLAVPFTIREDGWDDWHLSTGPICSIDGADPVMFYNGATNDARWRIGWISFDADYTRVTGRGIEPLLVPPPHDRTATDIAFAASSLVENDAISLYFSIEDRTLRRATVRLYEQV